MSIDLSQQILRFFEKRMEDHSTVVTCTRIVDPNNFLYRIDRTGELYDIIVHLSDAYFYGVHEFLSRPTILTKGDFILIARPEGNFADEALAMAKPLGIGIGQIGKFMGALNKANCWEYMTQEERRNWLEQTNRRRK